MDNEMKKSLVYETKANDVDEKGVVTVAVNGIGIEDVQHDISMPGSFNKTLRNDFHRMKWLLDHDPTKLLGVPLEGAEKDGNLVMVGQLNLDKQIGRDILADYKLFAEHGRTLEHSIGVRAIERDKEDRRKVKEWQMFEYSTLHFIGANPQTFLINIKSAPREQIEEAARFVRSAFSQHGYSDERLKNYDMELSLLLKSLNGDAIVSCPHCGYQFDYDSVPEQTFSQQALEMAANYLRWITEDIVGAEIGKLTPEIRAEVLALLDQHKGAPDDFTSKSITDIARYVRCPHCWARVYRTMLILQEDSTEKSDSEETPTEEPAIEEPETKKNFWQTMNEIL